MRQTGGGTGTPGLCQGKPLRGGSGDCACGCGELVDRPHRTVLRFVLMCCRDMGMQCLYVSGNGGEGEVVLCWVVQ